MTIVRLAVLQVGSKRYTAEGNDNAGLLVGDIRVAQATRSLRAFVKVCHSKSQLQAELVGAVIGRALGLSIPEPFLVVIPPESMPPIAINTPLIGFGTAAVDGHSFARLGNFEALHEHLKGLDLMAAFDQLMANGDRHLGQMLFDGVKCWSIDHGQSFGGAAWGALGLPAPSIDIINWLLERSAYGRALAQDDLARYKLRKTANQSLYPMVGNIGETLHAAGLSDSINEQTLRELYTWLESRISHAVEQLCHKIGLPDMGYAATSSTGSQPFQP